MTIERKPLQDDTKIATTLGTMDVRTWAYRTTVGGPGSTETIKCPECGTDSLLSRVPDGAVLYCALDANNSCNKFWEWTWPSDLQNIGTEFEKELTWKTDKYGNATKVLPTFSNISLILRKHVDWHDRLWVDVARNCIMLDELPLEDKDLGLLRKWLDAKYEMTALTAGMVHEAAIDAAQDKRVDLLRQYLRCARNEWDGTSRISEWLMKAIGAEDTELIRQYSRKFLIQAAARALKPGCQADTVLVLVGPQGTGKSTLFRLLAGDTWFSDTVIDFRSSDRFMQVNQAWIYEFAELASFRSTRSDAIKAFVTSRVDIYRRPYARQETRHARRVVFVATTNDSEFLADFSGSRRFWPVKSDGLLDREWLLENRNQLWGEAVHLLEAGESWHLDYGLEKARIKDSDQYEEKDPWHESIEAWATTRAEPFTMSQLLLGACGVAKDRQTMREQLRAGGVMRRLGFSKKSTTITVDGARVRTNAWHKPQTQLEVLDFQTGKPRA